MEVPPLLVMQGVVPEDPLRVEDLNQLGDKRFHLVAPGESTRGGQRTMGVLNGGIFHQDLAVEELHPPYQVLAGGLQSEVAGIEPSLVNQGSERSCATE